MTLRVLACLFAWALSGPLHATQQRATPDHIRIGLATDLESWAVACCAPMASADGIELGELPEGTIVRPFSDGAAGRFTVQVAALRDPTQADQLAEALAARWSVSGGALFDASSGTYKVRIGTFRQRIDAERLRDQVRAADHPQAWVVSEAVASPDRAVSIVMPGRPPKTIRTNWLQLRSGERVGVRHDGADYRGVLWLFVNERGRINVINELPLEQYLRGVVPREMGPESYPELEALKAQTVAARTYALGQIDAFVADGYDLCATPKCQVYGGLRDEHPLSDRAIAETRGEVLGWRGALAETLYSASCGGHTEEVEVPFPLRSGDHLVGVPCAEAGTQRLSGTRARGSGNIAARIAGVAAAELGGSLVQGESSLDDLLAGLARRRGLPTPRPVGSNARPDVQELGSFLASAFDLVLDTELIRYSEGLVGTVVGRWRQRFGGQAHAISPDVGTVLNGSLRDELVAGLAVELGVLRLESLQHHAITPDELVGRWISGRERNVRVSLRRSDSLVLFDHSGQLAEPITRSTVELIPGDVGLALVLDDRLLALEVTPRSTVPEITTRPQWRRRRTGRQLQGLIREAHPGFELDSVAVGRRGRSGRVAELQLSSRNGSAISVEGLAVRWTLDLPDTLFSMQVLHDHRAPLDEQTYLFEGRGWGHGVGLCQLGAVNMARFGASYRQILAHYYGGASVQHWRPGGLLVPIAKVDGRQDHSGGAGGQP